MKCGRIRVNPNSQVNVSAHPAFPVKKFLVKDKIPLLGYAP